MRWEANRSADVLAKDTFSFMPCHCNVLSTPPSFMLEQLCSDAVGAKHPRLCCA